VPQTDAVEVDGVAQRRQRRCQCKTGPADVLDFVGCCQCRQIQRQLLAQFARECPEQTAIQSGEHFAGGYVFLIAGIDFTTGECLVTGKHRQLRLAM